MPRLLWGLLPLATIDIVLFLVPMVIMALFSLRFSDELLGLTGGWTVAHYIKVFTSEGIYLRILEKTLKSRKLRGWSVILRKRRASLISPRSPRIAVQA